MRRSVVILGGGITGLAAGCASGGTVFEAEAHPGGLCATYALRPGGLPAAIGDSSAYRFERGGGHWLFGCSSADEASFKAYSRLRSYRRRASIELGAQGLRIPYPLQNHLRYLPAEFRQRALAEVLAGGGEAVTMKEWLACHFGPTLCEMFFHPFHESYTAGLYDRLAPQDAYKSPLDRDAVLAGAEQHTDAAGYNASFAYPEAGLGAMVEKLAASAVVRCGQRAVRIDTQDHTVMFEDGTQVRYDVLLSTLPLDRLLDIAGITVEGRDPYTSVLVANIGGHRGRRCPDDHWTYLPASRAGIYRVGFYSNVDVSFLPEGRRSGSHVSVYAERALVGGVGCSVGEREHYLATAIEELREWDFIDAVEVADTSWIETAYTWSWPGSTWRERALRELLVHGIHSIGRYGRWSFQGIAESYREGYAAGVAARTG